MVAKPWPTDLGTENQNGLCNSEDCTQFAVRKKIFIFAKMVKEMTQIILTVENPDIIPSLRKVLGQINGVTISKTKKIADTDKKAILKSIEKGYKEVKKAESERSQMPLLDDLIAELAAETY